jgi:hypothetical protein
VLTVSASSSAAPRLADRVPVEHLEDNVHRVGPKFGAPSWASNKDFQSNCQGPTSCKFWGNPVNYSGLDRTGARRQNSTLSFAATGRIHYTAKLHIYTCEKGVNR